MKRYLVAIAGMLLIHLMASPVMAAVNISVNGKTYQSIDKPQILHGCTMVTLDMVEKILGADVSVSGNKIRIINNRDNMEMTLNSRFAKINGKDITLTGTPIILNTFVMLPARAVFETLGARIGWQADCTTLSVVYNKPGNSMDAAEILGKMQNALERCKSYKVRMSIDNNLSKEYPDIPGSIETYNTHIDTDIASQVKPLLADCKIIEHRTDIVDRLGFESGVVANEKGLFIKQGKEPWHDIIESKVDFASLIYAAGSEEPISCLYQLSRAGAILSLGNDIERNGHRYWVIYITMSQEGLPDVIFGAMRGSPLWYLHGDLTGSYDKILKDMQAEMSYTVMVEQETFLPSTISFNSKRIFSCSETPSNVGGVNRPCFSISTAKYSGSCKIYGFGESFTVPDVSSATPGHMPEG